MGIVFVAVMALANAEHGSLLQQFRTNNVLPLGHDAQDGHDHHHHQQDGHAAQEIGHDHQVNELNSQRNAFIEREEGAVMQRLANIQHVEAEEMEDNSASSNNHHQQQP